MKNFQFFLFFCLPLLAFSQDVNVIDVQPSAYTVPQLVEDVFIATPCALISNITWSAGPNDQGVAYFDKNNSSFPIESGIVLASGDAEDAEGPLSGNSSGGWAGDPDLTELGVNGTNDATILEFDFVPFSYHMSFRFIFASYEYGAYQCEYSDIFAFFLTDSNGNTQNLAVVPGTTTPIAVTTVRDNQYNSDCPSQNKQFFDTYYGAGGVNPTYAPINYHGNTVVMVAQSPVTPGETYHIKLAIADAKDHILNSAVFLQEGSFNIGTLELGDPYLISDGTAPCVGESVTLDFDLAPITGVNITWFKDGQVIPGQNDTSLTVTEEGTYSVQYSYLSDCTLTDEVVVEFRSPPDIQELDDFTQCGNEVFDLTQIFPEMLGSNQDVEDFAITCYESLSDAEAGIPGTEIPNPETYTIATPPQQTIYVRVEDEYGCYDTTFFDIVVNPKAEVDISHYDGMSICVDLNPDTPVIGGNYEPITIDTGLSETDYIFNWSLEGEPLSETGSSVLANVPGEYTVTVTDITSTDPSCVGTSSVTILQSNPPEFDVKPVFFEGEIIISNVSGNGDYEFSTDQISWVGLGENTSLTLNVKQTGPVTVYGHDKNGCGTTIVEVWMIDYMQFFTPNGDGINDRWNVLGLQQQSTANLYIFDRFGKLLKTLDPAGPGWDGTYNGRRMPSNDYWFRLEYKSPEGTPKVFQNNFSLIR